MIILSGQRDFGRCPVASRLPLALWPVFGVPVLQRLLNHLSAEGVKNIVVCLNDKQDLTRHISKPDGIEIKFINEELPFGTAGCLRDAAAGSSEPLLLVLSASIIFSPPVDMLITAHCQAGSDLSIALNPPMNARSAGIYVCDRAVLKHIPEYGYCDIKEWLVPEMLRKGKAIKGVELPADAGNFRDGPGYLRAVANFLETRPNLEKEIPALCRKAENIWVDESADVDSSVKLVGPVVVMANARINKGAVIFGPSVIGKNCRLGQDTIVVNSILWDGAEIGANCEVRNCLLDYSVKIADNNVAEHKILAFKKSSAFVSLAGQVSKSVGNNIRDLRDFLRRNAATGRTETKPAGVPIAAWFAGIIIAVAFMWSYWPGIVDLWNIWQRSDEYSSGLLVPFLAGYVLWSRRESLAKVKIQPSLWGLVILLGAEGIRLFGLFFMYGSAERLSIVVSIAGLVLLLFGWRFFRKVVFILLFLCLMLPWPNRVQSAVTLPLQRWATASAVFLLEVMGFDVVQEGNIIHIGQATVAVAEACNGLRMITAFFVISGLVVLLIKRQWWEKLIILASSLPVALFCNTIRLAITAMAFTVLEGDYWEKIFHDFGGYAMMPVALAVVVAELWLLQRLVMPAGKSEPVIITR